MDIMFLLLWFLMLLAHFEIRKSHGFVQSIEADRSCRFIESRKLVICWNIDVENVKNTLEHVSDKEGVVNFTDLQINGLNFPNNKMFTNWFKSENCLINLKIIDENIAEIEPNAFNWLSFNELQSLALKKMPLQILRNGAFNGLRNLRELILIELNLKMITNETFFGLDSVRRLLLNDNQITTIAEYAFDVFAITLVYLDLSGNRLKSLPNSIFSAIMGSLDFFNKTINLEQNPWNCSCELIWLQDLLRKMSNSVVSNPICNLPPHLKGESIKKAVICGVNNTTAQIQSNGLSVPMKALPITTMTPSSFNKSDYETMYLYCPTDNDDYFVTEFERRDKFLRIITISENELMIFVRSFSNDYLMFWYNNDFMNDSATLEFTSCVDGPKIETQRITVHGYFLPNKIYIFCIANKRNLLIYPLNCIAYQHVVKQEPHQNETGTANQCQTLILPESAKIQIIAGMIAVYLVCVCAGAALIHAIHRRIGEIRKDI